MDLIYPLPIYHLCPGMDSFNLSNLFLITRILFIPILVSLNFTVVFLSRPPMHLHYLWSLVIYKEKRTRVSSIISFFLFCCNDMLHFKRFVTEQQKNKEAIGNRPTKQQCYKTYSIVNNLLLKMTHLHKQHVPKTTHIIVEKNFERKL